VLGLDVITTEDGAGWVAFLRGLVARGLEGVQLVNSDDHRGLVEAVASVLGSSGQRCRTHFARNVLTKVPRSAQPMVATLVRSIFTQLGRDEVSAQHARVVAHLSGDVESAAALLDDAREDILAFSTFPQAHRKKIWSNNPLERLNKKIRWRTDIGGIFPNRAAVIRLVGAELAEQHDEWAVARRFMGVESLTKARVVVIDGEHGNGEWWSH
jgi:putative transposase